MNDQQLNDLKSVIEINSFTHNKAGVDAVGRKFQELIGTTDFNWEITEHSEYGNLYFAASKKQDPNKPIVLLNGHLDTVFPENWPIKITQDKFYGPGGMDMKAGILVIIETIKKLQQSGHLTNILLLFTPDEEEGVTTHLKKQTEYYQRANYALVFEEGTWDRKDLQAKQRAVVVKRKSVGSYTLTIKGPGGHHGFITDPKDRHSAINEFARIVIDLQQLADYETGTLVNVGTVQGGTAPNVLAENLSARIDIRFGNNDEVARVNTQLAQIMRSSDASIIVELEQKLFFPSLQSSDASLQWADRVIELGKKLGLDINKQFRSSGSEANWIATLSTHTKVLDGFGVVGAGDHSHNEFFLLESFQQSVDLATEVITDLLA